MLPKFNKQTQGKRPLVKPWGRWEENITIDLEEIVDKMRNWFG